MRQSVRLWNKAKTDYASEKDLHSSGTERDRSGGKGECWGIWLKWSRAGFKIITVIPPSFLEFNVKKCH